MRSRKIWLWITWGLFAITMTGYLTNRIGGTDRRMFLPGPTSHGHYQIELRCEACHNPWKSVGETACLGCHEAELKAGNDTHPRSKFLDPRHAGRLTRIQADRCVTCHREHVPAQTRGMGVTVPEDYCVYCHEQTRQDRPSHRAFAFDSCATAGCHNYHDNTALYEDFLLKHAAEPAVKEPALRPVRSQSISGIISGQVNGIHPLSAGQEDLPAGRRVVAALTEQWAASAHAKAGVNCTGCHQVDTGAPERKTWSDHLDSTACSSCHEAESKGFSSGKHGMRTAQGLSPMSPSLARLPMKPASARRELTCVVCHGEHAFDVNRAAVESCLECHNDRHSLAYKSSAHFVLWQKEQAGEGPRGSGVSCATCHLPRQTFTENGILQLRVQHNQNDNLRPNEKMIRGVCLDCHGLAFSIDALADGALVQANFTGRPARHVESIDLAVRRRMESRPQPRNP